jgi:hypothetical protein
VALALTAAKKAVILLKNVAKTLPLDKAALAGKTVCMFGPNANSTMAQMAGYVPHPSYIVSPYAGMVDALPGANVKLVEGCNTTRCQGYDKAAVAAALPSCDVSVLVMGLTAYANPGNHIFKPSGPGSQEQNNACGCIPGDGVEGECCDREDVALPGDQLLLLQQVTAAAAAAKQPCVLVSVNAGMLDLSWAQSSTSVGAVINAPYLGMTAGTALASTLLGENNPGGRLPTTWYKSLADIGPITDYEMYPSAATGLKGRTHRYYDGPVLYPFGAGRYVSSSLPGSCPCFISS